MYAIIETGGKQYRVQEGDVINVELLLPEAISAKKRETVYKNEVIRLLPQIAKLKSAIARTDEEVELIEYKARLEKRLARLAKCEENLTLLQDTPAALSDFVEKNPQTPFEFTKVVFLSKNNVNQVGTPYLANASVKGEILDQVSGPKVISFKYKKRKGSRRKVGHRQKYSQVKITEIIG